MAAEATGSRSPAPPGEAGRGTAAAAGGRRRWQTLALHLAAPVALLAAALLLPSQMLTTTRPFRGAGLGPAAWPAFMLMLIAICCVLWAGQTALRWRRGALETPEGAAAAEPYSYAKALVGLALIVAYGWSLPWIGFALATVVFIAAWCALGGVRNPLAVLPVSVVGTALLLWVFMGLALMPLSRGHGAFDSLSIAVLRALGIY